MNSPTYDISSTTDRHSIFDTTLEAIPSMEPNNLDKSPESTIVTSGHESLNNTDFSLQIENHNINSKMILWITLTASAILLVIIVVILSICLVKR